MGDLVGRAHVDFLTLSSLAAFFSGIPRAQVWFAVSCGPRADDLNRSCRLRRGAARLFRNRNPAGPVVASRMKCVDTLLLLPFVRADRVATHDYQYRHANGKQSAKSSVSNADALCSSAARNVAAARGRTVQRSANVRCDRSCKGRSGSDLFSVVVVIGWRQKLISRSGDSPEDTPDAPDVALIALKISHISALLCTLHVF